jgi:hypothetical protein
MPDEEIVRSARVVLRGRPDYRLSRFSSDLMLAVGSDGSEFEFVRRFLYTRRPGINPAYNVFDVTAADGRTIEGWVAPYYRHAVWGRAAGLCFNCAFRTRAGYCQFNGRLQECKCRASTRPDRWSGFWRLIRRGYNVVYTARR